MQIRWWSLAKWFAIAVGSLLVAVAAGITFRSFQLHQQIARCAAPGQSMQIEYEDHSDKNKPNSSRGNVCEITLPFDPMGWLEPLCYPLSCYGTIDHICLEQPGIEQLNALAELPSVTIVTIHRPEGGRPLAGRFDWSQLAKLNAGMFDLEGVHDESLVLASMQGVRPIRVLNLTSCRLPLPRANESVGLDELRALRVKSHLTPITGFSQWIRSHVVLRHLTVDLRMLSHHDLENIANCEQLESMDLYGGTLEPSHIDVLSRFSEINELDLRRMELTTMARDHLGKMSRLKRLYIFEVCCSSQNLEAELAAILPGGSVTSWQFPEEDCPQPVSALEWWNCWEAARTPDNNGDPPPIDHSNETP